MCTLGGTVRPERGRLCMDPKTYREARPMSRTLSTLERCGRVSAVLVLTLLTASAPAAWAPKDPPGCAANSVVSVSLFALRDADSDGVPETQVLGSAVPPLEHETIYYVATLAKLSATDCAFEGGTLRITTPDGQPHDFPAIPCIGGAGGAARPPTPPPAVALLARPTNPVGGGPQAPPPPTPRPPPPRAVPRPAH